MNSRLKSIEKRMARTSRESIPVTDSEAKTNRGALVLPKELIIKYGIKVTL